jgi:hypothetical protein
MSGSNRTRTRHLFIACHPSKVDPTASGFSASEASA